LIGSSGAAITAAHVIEGATDPLIAMACDLPGTWTARVVTHQQTHPSEDVAVLRIEGPLPDSPISVSDELAHSGLEWRALGYPADIHFEVVDKGEALRRPDLVYLQGYVRRRISNISLDVVRGDHLLEPVSWAYRMAMTSIAYTPYSSGSKVSSWFNAW